MGAKLVQLDDDIALQMRHWRQTLHMHPELAFQEHRTALLIADVLRKLELEVTTGVAHTGIVATLRNGDGPSIGLRVAIDATPQQEQGQLPHRSRHSTCMHACGQDGHAAMLLGAASQLARHKNFRGTLHFIFQPAQEPGEGAAAMLADHLLERFHCDAIYGLHNWPGLPLGKFGIASGIASAALDYFEINVHGSGAHIAQPHQGIDSLLCASYIVVALQTIASRRIDPQDATVVAVTQLLASDQQHAVARHAVIRGSIRNLNQATRVRVQEIMAEIATFTATAHGACADIVFSRPTPAAINAEHEAELAACAARRAGGRHAVISSPPTLAAEDFAHMLQQRPGAYVLLGVDPPRKKSVPLNHERYDFNDQALSLGAGFFVAIAEQYDAAGKHDAPPQTQKIPRASAPSTCTGSAK